MVREAGFGDPALHETGKVVVTAIVFGHNEGVDVKPYQEKPIRLKIEETRL